MGLHRGTVIRADGGAGMTPQERCAEIAKQLYVGGQPPDVWVVMMEGMVTRHLTEAYREGFLDGIERAGNLCEMHEEATLSSGFRFIQRKTLENLNGTAYAEAIRALKPVDQ